MIGLMSGKERQEKNREKKKEKDAGGEKRKSKKRILGGEGGRQSGLRRKGKDRSGVGKATDKTIKS